MVLDRDVSLFGVYSGSATWWVVPSVKLAVCALFPTACAVRAVGVQGHLATAANS